MGTEKIMRDFCALTDPVYSLNASLGERWRNLKQMYFMPGWNDLSVFNTISPSLFLILPTGDTMEAPLVCLDEEFEDLRPCRMDELDHPALNHSSYSTTTTVPLASITREDFSELENFSEMMSFKSMEDLVNEFDEKLNVCFHNYNTKTEGLAPIRNQSHNQEDEEQLQDEEWVTTIYV